MCVSILVSEGEFVVTLTSTSICESIAETIVVVAVVVMSIVVLAIVVVTISILSVVVAVVVIVITAATTVVASPTKEKPFIPSILPLFSLSSLPAAVAGAGSTAGKEEPGFTILGLPFPTFAAGVAVVVEVLLVEGSSNCRSKDGRAKSTQTSPHKASVQSLVAREKPEQQRICFRKGSKRYLVSVSKEPRGNS